MLLRPGDRCVFPPARRRPLTTVFPLTVLAAGMHGRGGEELLDVTRRVLKYQGPARDFHGTPIRVRDLFPFDDRDDAVFAFLRVIDSWARVTDVPFTSPHPIMWHVREAHGVPDP